MDFSLKNVIHHGVEAAACIGVGSLVISSVTSATIAYGTAKISYMATRKLLSNYMPNMSLSLNQNISWGVGLLAGGGALYKATHLLAGPALNALETIGAEVVTTVSGMGVRALADKSFAYFSPNEMKRA